MDDIRAFGCDIGSTHLTLLLPGGSRTPAVAVKVPRRGEAPESLVPATIAHAEIGLSEVGTFAIAGLFGSDRLGDLDRKRCGLIVTDGFRDLPRLLASTGGPPNGDLESLIPLRRRFVARERVNAEGEIVTPLDEAGLRATASGFEDAGFDAVGIFFLHSGRNPTHEIRAAEIVRAVLPEAWVICSHEVCPSGPTLERLGRTMAGTLILPNLRKCDRHITAPLRRWGLRGAVSHTSALGRLLMNDASGAQLMECVDGGKTAGIVGAGYVAAASGLHDAIVCKIGGAHTRVTTVRHGDAPIENEAIPCAGGAMANHRMSLAELPLGGQSIARLDENGLLVIGPDMAPAAEGPACRGDGGTAATVTDAVVALGLLDPESLTDRSDKADPGKAREAIERTIATPLDLPVETVATAILDLFHEAIAAPIVDCLRGYGAKSKDIPVLFCGGAGPQHVAGIGRYLGPRSLIVPRAAGLLGAFGALVSDWQQDVTIPARESLAGLDSDTFVDLLRDAKAAIDAVPPAPTANKDAVVTRFELVVRIDSSGQMMAIPCPAPGEKPPEPRQLLAQATQARFGQQISPTQASLEAIRVLRICRRPGVSLDRISDLSARAKQLDQAIVGKAIGWFQDANEGVGGWLEVQKFDATRLPANARLLGPALIIASDTTVIVPPKATVAVDASGNLRLQLARSIGEQAGQGTEIARMMSRAG